MTQLPTIPALAALAGLMLAASPAAAADNTTGEVVSFEPEPVLACSNGDEIGLGFDIVRNVHRTYDDSGALVRERRNVRYTGIFEDLTTGEEYTFQGTRIVTFDFVAGTFTSTGNYRTVTQPGSGTVLHSAGREVRDLADFEATFSSGPKQDELAPGAADAVCGLFGLTA